MIGITDIIRGIYRFKPPETTQILAKSYDITEFICVDTPADEDFSIRVSMQDKYSELSAFDLADEIEGCSEDEAKGADPELAVATAAPTSGTIF